jgi:hypothetical protein
VGQCFGAAAGLLPGAELSKYPQGRELAENRTLSEYHKANITKWRTKIRTSAPPGTMLDARQNCGSRGKISTSPQRAWRNKSNSKPHLEQSMQEEQIREALNKHWQASAAGDGERGTRYLR